MSSAGTNITFGATGVYSPIYVGIQTGLFKQYGLNVKAETLTPTAVTAALLSGGIQLGWGSPSIAAGIISQPSAKVIMTTGQTVFYITTRKSITSVADLKGKTIAGTTPGSGTDSALRAELQKDGYKPGTDVKIAYLQTNSAAVAAVEDGSVAGTIVSPPTRLQATQAGLQLLVDITNETTPAVIGVNSKWAATNKDAVIKFVEALKAAVKLCGTNQADVADALKKYVGLKAPDQITGTWQAHKDNWVATAYPATQMALILQALKSSSPPVKGADSATIAGIVDNQYVDAGK